ncbi:hypothetical protein VNI00_001754 [Paramarasmius palmivorus]|uniref:Mid2 domain-containing protein n=1 Tax=Paramarasmius palmivorus TaxID=297713 RepID=A0AAW0E173_9AGAR
MFASSTKKLTLTLVASIVLILLLSPVSEANDFHAARRSHGDLKRVIRKRSPQRGSILDDLAGDAEPETETPPVASGSAVPTSSSASSAPVSSLPVPSSSAVSAPVSISSIPSSSASSSSSVASASSSAPSSSSSSSSSSVSSAVTPSTSPSTTAAPATPTSAESAPSQEPDVVIITTNGTVRTKTATAENAAQTSDDASSAPSGATSKTAKTTALTVLIVVASSVGAVVIIWTIFRKWKLARSSKFDQRLQPIDWQPTDREDGIIPAHRRNNSDTSSFHSGHGHGGYGATSDQGHGSNNGHARLTPLPDHDFTAGSSNLAPVGGYADLARGPSPSPSMQQLARGPSLTRPTYDTGVPLHHQSPYGARY